MPVTDVDRAKAFYVDQVGFNADHDIVVNESLRFVQLTPPGSACSIVLGPRHHRDGSGLAEGPAGLVVEDAEKLRDELRSRGVDASDVDKQPGGWFTYFSDPDGNTWAAQQMVPQT